MNTYIIAVEKRTVNEIRVQADTLEEAKATALRLTESDPDLISSASTDISTICKQFLPYKEKSA